MSKKPIIFVHVPKTAGTSFRIGAEQWFGADKICKDYGSQSMETSAAVREWILEKNDPWFFKKAFMEQDYCLFSGHVQAERYAQIFGMECMVTFLRDPLQRIVSEYQHFVRHNNYMKSFECFYRSKTNINRQMKVFQGIPWPALGFIGITEQYDLSLDLLNEKFDTIIAKFAANIGKSNHMQSHELSVDQEKELQELNSREIVFYHQVCQQLLWRKKTLDSEQVFARGMIGGINGEKLIGWAVYDQGDDPVHLQIKINGEQTAEAVASESRPHLQALGLRRGGFVGFSLDISAVTTADEISVTVSDTGQPLANSPWHVSGQ